MKNGNKFTIGTLAQAAGVGVETVRFYQLKGLLVQPNRPPGGIRRYDGDDLARLRFVKAAQRLGFSLNDVRELLRLQDGTHCAEAATIAARQLDDVRQKIAGLRAMHTALTELTRQCRTRRGSVTCPLISALHRSPGSVTRRP